MQKLEQSLKQTLKASLGIQQTINMLQLSFLEINQLIAQEMESNPFISEASNISENIETNDSFDSNFSLNNIKTSYSFNNEDQILNLAAEISLKDYILNQIYTTIYDHKERTIAYYLTDMLLDSGYIECDFTYIIQQLNCSQTQIESVLFKLQKLEPIGVFARDLAECLMIQLKEKGLYNNLYAILLQNLDKVARKDFFALAKLCNLHEEEVRKMVAVLKTFNPKPGNSFSSIAASARVPDVFVKVTKDGGLSVELNQNNMPKIQMRKDYYNELKSKVFSSSQRNFLKDKYQVAGIFISALEQRNNAILKVAKSIVYLQRSFFERGILYLKPLTLRDIAKDTGLSESTISRVTSNKHIESPFGLFEMKYFFSRSLQSCSSNQDNVSSTKVQEIIRKLIEFEDKNHIISDADIVNELAKFNIKIARRTVAKYRDKLKIPTAYVRKREKA